MLDSVIEAATSVAASSFVTGKQQDQYTERSLPDGTLYFRAFGSLLNLYIAFYFLPIALDAIHGQKSGGFSYMTAAASIKWVIHLSGNPKTMQQYCQLAG